MVAGTFRLDPVMVLKSDYFDWKIRIAASNYYNTKMNEQQEEAKKTKK